MNSEKSRRICPVERSGGLDNLARRLFQNPGRILKKYISNGMKVLDLGCGPGYFTVEIAKMVGSTGKVIAADLQQGMLDRIEAKIKGKELEQRIQLLKCEENRVGLSENVDFILCFYMVHEVPDQSALFSELKSILNPDGRILIIEPRFHVSKRSFDGMVKEISETGFDVIERPKVFFSRSVLIRENN